MTSVATVAVLHRHVFVPVQPVWFVISDSISAAYLPPCYSYVRVCSSQAISV